MFKVNERYPMVAVLVCRCLGGSAGNARLRGGSSSSQGVSNELGRERLMGADVGDSSQEERICSFLGNLTTRDTMWGSWLFTCEVEANVKPKAESGGVVEVK